MKSVLISIQPKWCELIARREKTVEVRKTKPKLETPFKVYIYCTKQKVNGEILLTYDKKVEGRNRGFRDKGDIPLAGKVIGEFVCDDITVAERGSYCVLPKSKTLIDELDLLEYADGKTVYGWHISDLVIYDKPKELNRFQKPCIRDCDCGGCENAYYTRDYGFEGCALEEGLTRPPQSWCYVEELG